MSEREYNGKGETVGPPSHSKSSRRRVWKMAGWAGGLGIAVLLIAAPLKIHPLDSWVGGILGHGDRAQDMSGQPAPTQLWTCGMDPQVIEDHPGQCPICKMDLVPLRTGTEAAGEEHGAAVASADKHDRERTILFYRNPMDAASTSPVPRKDEMGMDYLPVYADEVGKEGATVTIDPVTVQNMNVTTELIARRDVHRTIRTVGYLDYDQEKMVSVTTKYSGFVEKVYVDYLGQPVHKGQPLLDIYSPELLQTEQELLSAKQYVQRMQEAPAEARQRARSLLEAARTRLGYWDVTPDQIAKLESTGQVLQTLTVVAQAEGVVMKRLDGLEGMAVKPGLELLHIADLSSLWLRVEVFEGQLPWVDIDSEVKATFAHLPGQTYQGRVRYIEPQVADRTRTVQLTLEIPNADGQLRVGMYATVEFSPVIVKEALTVPSQAVLRTGERDIVIVAIGDGRFTPRHVVLGPEGDGFIQVLSGLDEGERIVTSGQFLIDSESNLRAAIQKMIAEKQP
jgi:RND family efflux transporter MFP subunit